MVNLLPNLFIQPVEGFTDKTRARTEDEIRDFEKRIGVSLPTTLRNLYLIQNGGSLYYEDLRSNPDHSFYGGFSRMSNKNEGCNTMAELLALTRSPEEILELSSHVVNFYPERLVIIGPNDGHSCWCLDYGYLEKDIRVTPRVTLVTDENEYPVIDEVIEPYLTFDLFLQDLKIGWNYADKWYLGVKTGCMLDEFVQSVLGPLSIVPAKKITDDTRSGTINVDHWYEVTIPFELTHDELSHARMQKKEHEMDYDSHLDSWAAFITDKGNTQLITSYVLPNQHRSGTYQFPDHKMYTLILEIPRTRFNTKEIFERFVKKLQLVPTVEDATLVLHYTD